jgi:hypothetical protein
LNKTTAGSKDDTDRCAASKAPTPRPASVEVSTSFAITFIPVHAVTKTFQPALAGNVFFSVASSHSALWKRLNPSTPQIHSDLFNGASADRTFGIAVAAAHTDESFYESMVVDISAGAVGTLGRRPNELRSLLAAI